MMEDFAMGLLWSARWRPLVRSAGLLAVGLAAGAAHASESGASFYLLGSGGPGAAIAPPVPGVFIDNTAYFYSGSGGGGKAFSFGGAVVADVHGAIPADFFTVLWVPSTNVLGGTLGLGAAVPFGEPFIHATTEITGPRANTLGLGLSQSRFSVGDPLLTGLISWKTGQRTNVELSSLVNIPAGDYERTSLSNLSFHRWGGDVSLAVTWRDPAQGWDVSGKVGVTFNGTNETTDYTTGTESHFEVSLEKIFSPVVSAGLQGYYFYQLSGDSGPGAFLGPFKGEVGGMGATVAWNIKAGKIPLTFRVRGIHEFGASNRLEGDSVWLDVSFPIYVKLPPGAPAG